MREINFVYDDPISVIWLRAAKQLGMTVRRDDECFAAWDGAGTLTIGAVETLDADDSLAQMIFHEICHALTEGPAAFEKMDWGLENDCPDHVVREHACLHLQAALASQHGLRTFLATTTDFRPYYDRLPDDPLADDQDAATVIAREAWERATHGPWAQVLAEALRQTAQVAAIVRPIADGESLWSQK